jgi:hypothetical protein
MQYDTICTKKIGAQLKNKHQTQKVSSLFYFYKTVVVKSIADEIDHALHAIMGRK